MKCEALQKKFWIQAGSFITMILIIMSTVMLKQHSILDVIYGIILSTVLYLAIYKFDMIKIFLLENSYRNVKDSE
jgi:membrane-associated phospholipid phosphatase